jgi:hypothetical protein
VHTAVEIFEVIGLVMEVVRFLILKPMFDPILELQIETRLVGHVLFPVRKSAFLFEELCNPHELMVILA